MIDQICIDILVCYYDSFFSDKRNNLTHETNLFVKLPDKDLFSIAVDKNRQIC